jgi:hypothetical protein
MRLAALVLFCVSWASSAQAGFIISTPNVGPITAGTSGSFDVVLENSISGPDYSLDSYGIQLSVSPSAKVTFTNVTSEAGDYVFAGNSLGLAPDPFVATPNTASWNDFSVTAVPMTGGTSFTIGRVYFSIAVDATPGTYSLGIEQGIFTALFDFSLDLNNTQPFTVSEGSIQILAAPPSLATPAPPSLILLLVGLGTMYFNKRKRLLQIA